MLSKLNRDDIIAAEATSPGRGGVAIIRVSGPSLSSFISQLLGLSLKPREAVYLPFCGIDKGIALYFAAPHSFTGEDVLELHCHGSPIVVDMLLQRIIKEGARLARPGEFSERAFLNGKMDLVEAEAIADLINAQSEQAARLAVRSMQGEFSKVIVTFIEKVTVLRMYIEAAIDFSDEEIDFLSDQHIQLSFDDILQTMQEIKAQAKQGSFLREGITVVIAGKPNVGKSSLLNKLSGRESAIVTHVPGTTRDVLREYISLDGIPLHVIDTAGLRMTDDVVELEGMRRAYDEMGKADLLLHVVSAEDGLMGEEAIDKHAADIKKLVVRNKIDLIRSEPSVQIIDQQEVVSLSVLENIGIDLLKDEIKKLVGIDQQQEGIFLARRRHLDALERAHQYILAGYSQLQTGYLPELTAEDLRLAQQSLSEITGEFSADDLLGRIFSSFCIGK